MATINQRVLMAAQVVAVVAEHQLRQVAQETRLPHLHHKEVMAAQEFFQPKGLAVAVAVLVQLELMALVAQRQPVELAATARHQASAEHL